MTKTEVSQEVSKEYARKDKTARVKGGKEHKTRSNGGGKGPLPATSPLLIHMFLLALCKM